VGDEDVVKLLDASLCWTAEGHAQKGEPLFNCVLTYGGKGKERKEVSCTFAQFRIRSAWDPFFLWPCIVLPEGKKGREMSCHGRPRRKKKEKEGLYPPSHILY